jgi:hypothetical protein
MQDRPTMSRDEFLAEAKRLGLEIPAARVDELHGAYVKLMGHAARLRSGLAAGDDLALEFGRDR